MTQPSTDPCTLLGQLEQAVQARRHAEAFAAAASLLDALDGPAALVALTTPGSRVDPYTGAVAFCGRFAAAWSTLLLDDAVTVAQVPVVRLLRSLQTLHLLVHGSPVGHLDDAMRTLHRRVGGRHSGASGLRFALLWVPGSRLGIDLFALYASMPQVIAAQAVATVAALVACTPETDAARTAAIDFLNSGRARPEDYAVFGMSPDLGAAWMRCSYAPSPTGHDVKNFLNAVLLRCARIDAVAAPSSVTGHPGMQPAKPVMLVPLDQFASHHAMYRCYAPVIVACRARFRVVALVRRGTLDAPAEQLFDEILDADAAQPVAGESSWPARVRLAQSCRPDLVFYPSVGMRQLTAVLALQRLAPVQAMTVGHPASSFSPQMDFLLTETQWVVDPARYRECVVPLPRGTLRYSLPAAGMSAAVAADDDAVVRVAVPSICQKWTWPFLETLQRVAARAGTRAEFHFFSGVTGCGHAAAVAAVRRFLPEAVVHPALPYEKYVAALARCHLQAGTFPFGGTNSIIDSLLHGLPVLCMAPVDARGAQDADFVERAGLPDWLVAADVDSYADKLLRLIEDRAWRDELRSMLADRARVASVFMDGGKPEAFADALYGLLPSRA